VVSKTELLAAAARTDLPAELLLDAVPFPFPALVFMLPKGTIRHPIEGDCPYIVVSRTEKGQVTSLPLKDIRVSCAAPETAVTTSTYLPAENRAYYKSISVVPGETLKAACERASKIPLELPDEDSPEVEADFIERLWRLGLTLVLIMASGEKLVETGRRLKIVKPKNCSSSSTEYWSPNYLGRVYTSQSQDAEAESHLRPHWRKGHLKIRAIWPKAISAKIYLASALPYWAIRLEADRARARTRNSRMAASLHSPIARLYAVSASAHRPIRLSKCAASAQ
jgi:hypothetical protein